MALDKSFTRCTYVYLPLKAAEIITCIGISRNRSNNIRDRQGTDKCRNTPGYWWLTYVTGSHCVGCRSLGKVFNTPEVARVYIGSFWDSPLHFDMNRRLFELEEQDLFKDIQSLPRNAALRKLNDLIKRARLAKVSRSRPSERSLGCFEGSVWIFAGRLGILKVVRVIPRSFGRAEGQLVFLKVGWSF